MNNFPVNKLTADIIELSGDLLLNENGDLTWDGKILALFEDLPDVLVVNTQAEFNSLREKGAGSGKNSG